MLKLRIGVPDTLACRALRDRALRRGCEASGAGRARAAMRAAPWLRSLPAPATAQRRIYRAAASAQAG